MPQSPQPQDPIQAEIERLRREGRQPVLPPQEDRRELSQDPIQQSIQAALSPPPSQAEQSLGALKYLGEAAYNLPSSAWGQVEGLASALGGMFPYSPDEGLRFPPTVQTFGQLAYGAMLHGMPGISEGGLLGNPESHKIYQALERSLSERYGSMDQLKQTFKQDPAGTLADISMLLSAVGGVARGGARLASSAPRLASGLEKAGAGAIRAGEYIDPIAGPLRLAVRDPLRRREATYFNADPLTARQGFAFDRALGTLAGIKGERPDFIIRQARLAAREEFSSLPHTWLMLAEQWENRIRGLPTSPGGPSTITKEGLTFRQRMAARAKRAVPQPPGPPQLGFPYSWSPSRSTPTPPAPGRKKIVGGPFRQALEQRTPLASFGWTDEQLAKYGNRKGTLDEIQAAIERLKRDKNSRYGEFKDLMHQASELTPPVTLDRGPIFDQLADTLNSSGISVTVGGPAKFVRDSSGKLVKKHPYGVLTADPNVSQDFHVGSTELAELQEAYDYLMGVHPASNDVLNWAGSMRSTPDELMSMRSFLGDMSQKARNRLEANTLSPHLDRIVAEVRDVLSGFPGYTEANYQYKKAVEQLTEATSEFRPGLGKTSAKFAEFVSSLNSNPHWQEALLGEIQQFASKDRQFMQELVGHIMASDAPSPVRQRAMGTLFKSLGAAGIGVAGLQYLDPSIWQTLTMVGAGTTIAGGAGTVAYHASPRKIGRLLLSMANARKRLQQAGQLTKPLRQPGVYRPPMLIEAAPPLAPPTPDPNAPGVPPGTVGPPGG